MILLFTRTPSCLRTMVPFVMLAGSRASVATTRTLARGPTSWALRRGLSFLARGEVVSRTSVSDTAAETLPTESRNWA